MTLAAGPRLGPYEILSPLCSGGWVRCCARHMAKGVLWRPGKGKEQLVVVTIVLLAVSGLLSTTFLTINVGLFLLAAAFPLSASAVNNNVGHVRETAVNLVKWHQQDAVACSEYCERSDS